MASDGTLKFDTSLDTGGLQSGMGKVASVAQQALGVFTGQMMTRAVDALANLGKSALDSVGQLEQNVGGVETLFGDAADAVIASADRAYQTAGMSANDYMSTVTSFSASLLQSLGGNTEEAAKVADMAIIDMADNANKMGTSMDMIQNAYQGFAKQNYTMLDNLKLGYGGTKTEMERLLADAEKLTGVKYDINNLNDVYQAIHAVQEEMGITGHHGQRGREYAGGLHGFGQGCLGQLHERIRRRGPAGGTPSPRQRTISSRTSPRSFRASLRRFQRSAALLLHRSRVWWLPSFRPCSQQAIAS